MNSVHYDVAGVLNSFDKTKVKRALDKVPGVQTVCVDVHRGTIEVEYNSPATPEEIRNSIEGTGFYVNVTNQL